MHVCVHPTLSEPYWKQASEILLLRAKASSDQRDALANLIGKDLLDASEVTRVPRHVYTTLATWRHVPLFPLPYHLQWFRWFHRLQTYALPYAVLSLLWLIIIAGVQVAHPAILMFTVLFVISGILFQMTQLDVILLKTLLYQFEFWFLTSQAVLYCIFSTWCLHESSSAVHVASFLLPVIVHSCATLTCDAAVLQSYVLKGLLYASALILFVQTFIRDLVRDDMGLRVYPICVLFCTDSRRMMLVCSLNLALFYGKYLSQIVAGLIKQRTRFVMIRIPLSITPEMLTVGQDDLIPSPRRIQLDRAPSGLQLVPPKLNPAFFGHFDELFKRNKASMARDSPDAPSRDATFMRVDSFALPSSSRSLSPTTGHGLSIVEEQPGSLQRMPSPRSLTREPARRVNADSAGSSNAPGLYLRLTAKVFDTIRLHRLNDLVRSTDLKIHRDALMCVTRFRPVVSFPWAISIAQARWYRVFFFFWFVAAISVSSGFVINESIAATLTLMTVGLFLFFFELTRFDRSMAWAVMGRFEWIVLCWSTIQLCIFAPWAQIGTFDFANNLIIFFGYGLMLAVVLGLSDAAPTYPYYIRLMLAVGLFFNSARVLVQNYFSPYYHDYPVCFIFCTDTALLALSPTATCAIFLAKYVYSLVRFPRRCIIACTYLHFSLATTNRTAIRHMAETSVLRPEVMSSPGEDHDENQSPRSQSISVTSIRGSSSFVGGNSTHSPVSRPAASPSLRASSSPRHDASPIVLRTATFPLVVKSATPRPELLQENANDTGLGFVLQDSTHSQLQAQGNRNPRFVCVEPNCICVGLCGILSSSFRHGSDVARSLPHGWTLYEDPLSTLPYYHHAASGRTVWSRPETSEADEAALGFLSSESGSPNGGAAAPPALPPFGPAT